MSAEQAVVTGLLAALAADRALMRVVHGVYDRLTPRASVPFIEIGGVVSSEWGTKDRAGCELRIAVRHVAAARDGGVVAERVAAVVAALRGPAGAGEIVSARVLQSRSGFNRQVQWEQSFELRVRWLGVG